MSSSPCKHLLSRLGRKCPKCGLLWVDLSTPSMRAEAGLTTVVVDDTSLHESDRVGEGDGVVSMGGGLFQKRDSGSDLSGLTSLAAKEKNISKIFPGGEKPTSPTPTPGSARENFDAAALGLSPEKEEALRKTKERRACQKSFASFCQKAWYHIPHLSDTKLEWSWHHDALCDHLQRMVEDWYEAKDNASEADRIQKVRNLIVNIAPGSTKTLIVMILFPSWVWTRYPRWTVRCVSSNPRSILESSDFSRQLVTSDWYVDLFIPKDGKEKWAVEKEIEPWAVRDDKNAVSDWGNTLGGSRRSTGLSAAVTGEHTDWILCVSGDTKVQTEFGEIKIKDIGAMETLPRVWSYNTKTKKTELKRITKWMYTGKKKTIKVRASSGEVLQCTDDHPIWTSNRGYVEAGTLVSDVQRTDASIKPGKTETPPRVQECLPCVRNLFEELHPGCGRARQTSAERAEIRTLLLNEVPTHHAYGTSHNSDLCLMPASIQPWIDQSIQSLLFEGMLNQVPRNHVRAQTPTETLRQLSDHDANSFVPEDLLLSEMQERSTLQSYDGQGEFELFGQADEVLRRRTLGQSLSIDSREGWLSLHSLPENETVQGISDSSHRRKHEQQHTGESDHLVRFVSHDPSQVEQSTVSFIDRSTESGCGSEIDVYDITVEDNHNFFANGLLVHNCDDPHDAEQVNSEEMRTGVIAKWDNALFNRVNDRRTACRVLVMQRLRHDDLSGHIIERDRNAKVQIWALLIIASEFEADNSFETPFGWKDPRFDPVFYEKCGGLLDPVRFSKEGPGGLNDELNRLTPRGYAAQHQQRPDSDDAVNFKIAWWGWYKIFGAKVPDSWERPVGAKTDETVELLRNKDGSLDLDWVCVSVDASGGSIEEGASAVGILIVGGKGMEKRFVLDDCTPGPRGFNDQLEDVKKAVERAVRLTGKRSIKLLVEKKAYGGAVLEQIQKQIKKGDFGMVDGRPVAVHFEAYEVKAAMGSKEQRGLALEPDLFAGYIYIPEGAPWLVPFLAEFKRFPSAPNDRVDALVQCIEKYRKRITWAQAYKKVGK